MNLKDKKFAKFALVKEMLETSEVVRNFDLNQRGVQNVASLIRKSGRVFLTGEGSSRIFPAKNFIANVQSRGLAIATGTQGSFQALECDLSNWVVCGASNSGETKEIINLLVKLRDAGKKDLVAVTATKGSTLTKIANESIILSCGREKAVAATKSVVEQGLVYSAVLAQLNGCSCLADNQAKAADALTAAMETEIDPKIVAMLQKAPMIYFAGRNNGVAEELTLKTNEIVRNKSDYLEGTYLLHGVEEVMREGEVCVLIEPFRSECAKIKELIKGRAKVNVVAIATKNTPFPTIKIPQVDAYDTFIQLVAGWNLLVNAGVALDIDLDHPTRARKVGNEYEGKI